MKTSSPDDSFLRRMIPCLLMCLLPSLAQAHPGIPGHAHGLADGLSHPLTGLDHVCAMIAVGLWAAQRGGRIHWLLPLTFITFMLVGGILGMGGMKIPFVEQGIVASVFVLGVLIAAAIRLPSGTCVAIVGSFAVFHGYAHGAEMPATNSGLVYGIGFVSATAGLLLGGIGLGRLAQRCLSIDSLRYAGVAIAGCGIYLCWG